MTTISGRVYKRTRPRGFADWSPRPDTLALLEQVGRVLAEYEDHLPLTARQLFYRLVGSVGYEKTENAYARLCETLNRARRARLIPMSAIRDDGTVCQAAGGFSSPAGFWRTVRSAANRYRHHPAEGQPLAVEVWVEAGGMVPMVARVAHRYGADVYSSGGFDSVTAKYEAALRMVQRDRTTNILHVGDLDPSGLSVLDSVAEDVTAFYSRMSDRSPPQFVRVAVTPWQVEAYGLETAPQKTTDRRGEHMAETVQAEALSPDQIADELDRALVAWTDLESLASARERSATERQSILETLSALEAGGPRDW
jgi:hypothetical protein